MQAFVEAVEDCCLLSLTLFQSDSTGKLGFHEFKHLWNNIKKWQASTAGLFCFPYTSLLHSYITLLWSVLIVCSSGNTEQNSS